MKKINLFAGKNILAAGIFGILVTLGANAALAAEDNTPVQTAGGIAVDAKGAEELALADAAAAADKVERLHIEADREDGENVYEVSFTVEGVDYEYLIREADGVILEWEMEGKDLKDAVAEQSLNTASSQTDTPETELSQSGVVPIGLERAKEIALLDAAVDTAKASITKIKYEDERNLAVYEVEFYQDRQEFEYTIDAYTGEVREMERD